MAAVLSLTILSAAGTATAAPAAAVPGAMPAAANPAAKYLFFHHNYYVETKGPDAECKYQDLLKAFTDKGYVVISEIRPKDASVVEYGKKAAADVRKLLGSGVPPRNIVVAGHSKGGVITLQAAAELEEPEISYLVLAGCGIKGLEKGYPDFTRLKGKFLSLYASSDKVAGSCQATFSKAAPEAVSASEIALESEAGHQLFFKPSDVWLAPAAAWLKREK